jgi:hypothetical protein
VKKVVGFVAAVLVSTGFASTATATTISANAWPGALTPPFGALVAPVGGFYVGQGVDFSFGAVEGVFNDGGAYAYCGINAAGNCDLLTAVDGAFVDLVDSVFVEAGFANPGALTLEVFGTGLNLLASMPLNPPPGPNGRWTAQIDRGGLNDIAYFRVSGSDSFGVNTLTFNAVPEPATLALFGTGLAAIARRRMRRK